MHARTASPGAGQPTVVDAAELRRHQRALRVLVVVLIPLAVWTVAGLVLLWPGDISRSVNADVAGYSVPGVTYPTAGSPAWRRSPATGSPARRPACRPAAVRT